MVNLSEEIEIQKQFIEDTLQVLLEALSRKNLTRVEIAAIATFLHNFYNGIENILTRILKHQDISIPFSASSHKDLLELAILHQIISVDLSEKLDEFRAFRHFFVHGYGIHLDQEKLTPLARKAPRLWKELWGELKNTL